MPSLKEKQGPMQNILAYLDATSYSEAFLQSALYLLLALFIALILALKLGIPLIFNAKKLEALSEQSSDLVVKNSIVQARINEIERSLEYVKNSSVDSEKVSDARNSQNNDKRTI